MLREYTESLSCSPILVFSVHLVISIIHEHSFKIISISMFFLTFIRSQHCGYFDCLHISHQSFKGPGSCRSHS